ncbi:hypothetical protein J2802_003876 [Paraburkholderia caribensis]|nr:hypothetical protein [Paraburkholderia caribensis]
MNSELSCRSTHGWITGQVHLVADTIQSTPLSWSTRGGGWHLARKTCFVWRISGARVGK